MAERKYIDGHMVAENFEIRGSYAELGGRLSSRIKASDGPKEQKFWEDRYENHKEERARVWEYLHKEETQLRDERTRREEREKREEEEAKIVDKVMMAVRPMVLEILRLRRGL